MRCFLEGRISHPGFPWYQALCGRSSLVDWMQRRALFQSPKDRVSGTPFRWSGPNPIRTVGSLVSLPRWRSSWPTGHLDDACPSVPVTQRYAPLQFGSGLPSRRWIRADPSSLPGAAPTTSLGEKRMLPSGDPGSSSPRKGCESTSNARACAWDASNLTRGTNVRARRFARAGDPPPPVRIPQRAMFPCSLRFDLDSASDPETIARPDEFLRERLNALLPGPVMRHRTGRFRRSRSCSSRDGRVARGCDGR